MWMSAIGTKRTLRERDGYGALQIFDQAAKLMRTGYRPSRPAQGAYVADDNNTWQFAGSFYEHQAVTRGQSENACTDNSH
jgi:hypothetical protein